VYDIISNGHNLSYTSYVAPRSVPLIFLSRFLLNCHKPINSKYISEHSHNFCSRNRVVSGQSGSKHSANTRSLNTTSCGHWVTVTERRPLLTAETLPKRSVFFSYPRPCYSSSATIYPAVQNTSNASRSFLCHCPL
jgi:hypothetical protein